MKKKNNKNEPEKMFASNEVMSFLENMSDGIGIIAEQQGELTKKIDKLEEGFDGLEGRFDGLERKIDQMQGDISEIKYELKRKVGYDEFEKLEKRVMKLEKLSFAR
ncbi:MAG: hypothetical protein ACD_11C00047G0002 [uncultured bacterium]|nr:MAG: hypothetical protein ACD_11C00047G0002 [uncultured bacterium]